MSWTLVYAHDVNGNETAGNVGTLINAVLNGQGVRVLMQDVDTQSVIDAQGLWVKNGVVHAQNTSLVSVLFVGDVLKFQDDSYHFMLIVSTKSDRDMIRWKVGEHSLISHTSDKVALKWFVG